MKVSREEGRGSWVGDKDQDEETNQRMDGLLSEFKRGIKA
jgi:hypothetical protein